MEVSGSAGHVEHVDEAGGLKVAPLAGQPDGVLPAVLGPVGLRTFYV